jgi:beta-N-acetylhexosaminidase
MAVAALLVIIVGDRAEAVRVPAPRPADSQSAPAYLSYNGNVAFLGTSLLDPALVQPSAQTAAAVLVARLSARQLAGQRVIYSYSGPAPPASLLSLIRHGEAGGVIFFAANYRSRSQFTRVVRALESANASGSNPAHAYPLLLMTDQEGGEVRRLPGAPVQSEEQIGGIRPLSAAEAAARRAGAAAAANLRSYGLNVNLAPVLDVYRTRGDFDDKFQRSYSRQASVVSALGAGFIAAQQAGHVAATVKHFPGLGAATASQNTDNRPVTLSVPAATLESDDEYPYRAAIRAGVKLVMVSWAKYPALDPRLPAGLSPAIVQGQLRARLGFAGVTITDAIGAGALGPYGSTANRAQMAAKAGMDLILAASLTSTEGVQCMNGLEGGYRDGVLGPKAFRAAVTQVLTLRQGLPA